MKARKSFRARATGALKWWVIALAALVVVLIIARLLLPSFVLKKINKELANMSGYYGHVEDVDIWLIRGAYIIKDMRIWETDSSKRIKDTIPYFKTVTMDLSVEWKALFHGRLAGEIVMHQPVVNFKASQEDETNFAADTADFRQLVRELMPLTINHFTVQNGQMHYMDLYTDPKVDLVMTDINATGTNLSNVLNKDTPLPARVIANGKTYGGQFHFNLDLDPLNKVPTFDLNAEVVHADVTGLNDFLRAYACVDAEGGEFNGYMEFAGRDNQFKGYIKPMFKDLNIKVWKEDKNIVNKMWRGMVAGLAFVLKNQRTDELATKATLSGSYYSPNIGAWNAVKYVLINAFIEALKPSIENTINIENVVGESKEKKEFMGKVFGDEKKK